jgi:hypothetical protein
MDSNLMNTERNVYWHYKSAKIIVSVKSLCSQIHVNSPGIEHETLRRDITVPFPEV